MKKILTILIIGIMCLGLFSCGESDVPEGMKLASDTKTVDYELFVPEEWQISDAERGATQAYVSDEDRTNVLVMQWNITENTKTVADWWEKEYKPQVFDAEAVKDVKVANDKGEAVTLDKLAATKYSYTGKIGDSYFKYDIIACVTRGSIYVMQFTYMQDNVKEGEEITYSAVETHKEEVQKIVDNFRFK